MPNKKSPHTGSGIKRTANDQAERRKDLRHSFTAAIEAFDPLSRTKLSARTSDISLTGCYIDTINPFPVSSAITIRLTKDGVTFESDARVVLSQPSMGMGIVFTSDVPQQTRILHQWLNQLRGEPISETLPSESGIGVSAEQEIVAENTQKIHNDVLVKLLAALIAKEIISDEEGKEMLRDLDF